MVSLGQWSTNGWFSTPMLVSRRVYRNMFFFEGSLGVKLPTNMDRWKSRAESSQRRKRVRRERGQRLKVMKHYFSFQCSVAPEGRKVGLLKRRVQSHLGKCEIKNCSPLWRDAHLEVKTQNCEKRPMFGTLFQVDVEKVCAAAMWSTFWRHNVQTKHSRRIIGSWDAQKVQGSKHIPMSKCAKPRSVHFWKLRCRKGAHRCGAKNMMTSKPPHVRTTFAGSNVEKVRCGAKHVSKSKCHCRGWDVEKVHAAVAQSAFPSQNALQLLQRRQLHATTATLDYSRLQLTSRSLHCTTTYYNYTTTTYYKCQCNCNSNCNCNNSVLH